MTTAITLPTIRVDLNSGTLIIADETITHLREPELLLMQILLAHRGTTVSHENIRRHLYDDRHRPRPATNTIKVYICTLRDAFEHANHPRTTIENARREGYFLQD